MLFGLHIENMLLVLLGNRFTGTGWTYALINPIETSSKYPRACRFFLGPHQEKLIFPLILARLILNFTQWT